ncbi:TPA: hypothetical protein ACH3X1_015626 [Trebouxia sp. C0004]
MLYGLGSRAQLEEEEEIKEAEEEEGLAFNAAKWATEFFDFAGQKAAEKLQNYLHLEEVQDLIPSFDSVSHAEQLAQSRLASGSASFLQDLSAQDIQQAASHLAETAVSTIVMFQHRISHGLLEWANAQQAPQHLSAFLGKLAILEKRHIYVFDLDSDPASCNVYPLLPQDNFKVLLPKQLSKKQAPIIRHTGLAALSYSVRYPVLCLGSGRLKPSIPCFDTLKDPAHLWKQAVSLLIRPWDLQDHLVFHLKTSSPR